MSCKRARLSHNPWSASSQSGSAGGGRRQLFDYVVGKFVSGRFTADEVCTLAHLIQASGGAGLEEFNMGPMTDVTKSHASRKVRDVISSSFRLPNLYYAGVPMNEKLTSVRTQVATPMRLPHEAILEDYDPADFQHITFESELEEYPLFCKHPIVVAARAADLHLSTIVPVALYWDGIVYSKNDSVLCYYAQNMRSKKKYLLAALRPGFSGLCDVYCNCNDVHSY